MGTKIILPKSGMGIEEATVSRWLRAVGDHVSQGEILVEVETAKALQEVEAPVTGTLSAIYVVAGQEVAVNSEIGLIE